MKLSIIIPCYNESRRIKKNLDQKISFLKSQKYKIEIILVDDGSKDDTKQLIEDIIKKYSDIDIKLIAYGDNQGKGYAVRQGMLQAKGDYCLFSDLDNSTPIQELSKLLQYISKSNIIIASRYIKGAKIIKKQTFIRRVVSRLGNLFIRIIIGLNLKDTQCGFKLFKKDAAKEIFSLIQSRRWGFDVEVLLLAKKMGYSIMEIPITWTDVGDSKLQPIKASIMVFLEAIKSKYNILTNKYHINVKKNN